MALLSELATRAAGFHVRSSSAIAFGRARGSEGAQVHIWSPWRMGTNGLLPFGPLFPARRAFESLAPVLLVSPAAAAAWRLAASVRCSGDQRRPSCQRERGLIGLGRYYMDAKAFARWGRRHRRAQRHVGLEA